MTDYEGIRKEHIALLQEMIPEHLERLTWSREQINSERRNLLRQLLKIVKEKSPWHSKRLRHINPDTITLEDIRSIPPMTRNDLMSNWDDIVTDRRLNLKLVENHLDQNELHTYLFDEYTVCASGGSSGRRGVFIYDRKGLATSYLAGLRHRVRKQVESQSKSTGPSRLAFVGSHHHTHMAYAFHQIFGFPGVDKVLLLGVKDPIVKLVDKLNVFQPTHLIGYPSMLKLLAKEQERGQLSISPQNLATASEPLFADIREVLVRVWGVPVLNIWAMSEMGACGHSFGYEPGLILNDDLSIIEPVDRAGNAVRPGIRSEKIFITNLFNHILPLLRLEVTDEITVLDEGNPRDSGHRMIADVEGRMDDIFTYDEGKYLIHPHVFRTILSREENIIEYQVRQTKKGAQILVVSKESFLVEDLKRKLVKSLKGVGLDNPEIIIHSVDQLERLNTGKLKRFIPLVNNQS